MLERVKLLIIGLATVFSVAAPAAVAVAQGVTKDPVACGIELQPESSGCTVSETEGEGRVMGIIKTVIDVLSILVGSICIIMIIFGGFRYMTSGGESAGVTSGKNTILYAVVGLVVVLLAQGLVRFVFSRVTSD